MNRNIVLAVFFPLLAGCGASGLQGNWEVTEYISNGQPGPKTTFVITSDRLTMNVPKEVDESGMLSFSYTLNPSTKPPTITTISLNGDFKGQTTTGIYSLEGNTLMIAWAGDSKQAVPTEFGSKPGSNVVYYVLQRAK